MSYAIREANEKELLVLEKRFSQHPNKGALDTSKSDEEIGAWTAEGKPHCWGMVEERNGYKAFVDFGYGMLALFKGDALVSAGRSEVITETDAVLLDKEYYNTPGWLYFR